MSQYNLAKPPERLETWSVDEVAECLEGITSDVYDELWKCMADAEAAGTDKPLGGDGSDGTSEEPIVSSGEYGSDLVAAWPELSDEARRQIHEAAAARET
jgi:hypothetical protein